MVYPLAYTSFTCNNGNNMNKSEAKALYWSKIPKEERSKKASKMAKRKASLMSVKERSEHGKKMIAARLSKRIK